MAIKFINILIPIQNVLIFYYIVIIALGLLVNEFRININYLFTYIVLATVFGVSIIIEPNTYAFQYLMYFSAFYLASNILQFQVSVKDTFKTINLLNVPFALYLFFVIFESASSGTLDPNFTMNLSYTALIGISAFFLSIKLLDYNQSRLLFLANGVCVVIEFYFMFVISSNRGALLGIVVLLAIILLRKIKNPFIRFFALGIFVSVGIYAHSKLLEITLFINNLLITQFDIRSNLFSKTIWKLTEGDFASGRSTLYDNAIEFFTQSPFFGKGIGSFAAANEGQYPHNILLDTLSSLGLFATVILLAFCVYVSFKILTVKNGNYLLLAIFLFVLSLPRLFISSTLWMSPFFWALVVLIMINPKLKDKEEQTDD